MTDPWPEARSYSPVVVARLFDVAPHLVTCDLPPGYWSDQLARDIARRSIRRRLSRALRRWTGA